MTSENLTLWKSVEKTDPRYTKRVNVRGGFTAIDPTYQAMKATEKFGPYGQGWGLSSIDYMFDCLDATGMVICKAVFFYVIDGKRAEFPIHNSIKPTIGAKSDEDFCKKLETNTISKALSKIGFSADVFMGLFDDIDYVNQVGTEKAIENAENKEAEVSKAQEEMIAYVKNNIEAIKHSPSKAAASGIMRVSINHLERRSTIKELSKICFQGIERLKEEFNASFQEETKND